MRGKGYRQIPTVRLELTALELADVYSWMLEQPQEELDRTLYDKISSAAARIDEREKDKR